MPSVVIGGLGSLLVAGLWMMLFPGLRRIDRYEPADTRAREGVMHILITGAAGMIGRKLDRKAASRTAHSNGKPIDRLTLIDVVPPERPQGFSAPVEATTSDLSSAGRRCQSGRWQARRDLPSRRRRVRRGGDRFREGLSRSISMARAHCSRQSAAGGGYNAEGGVHLVDRGVRRAISADSIPRRIPSHAADLLRHAEGDLRAAARRLHAHAASSTASASGCRRICVRPGKPNKAASGFFSGIIREPLAGQEAVLPVSESVLHTHASPRCGGRIPDAMRPALTREQLGPRINLPMPGVSCTVGEQIDALRRVAGDKVAARIRREPDELIMQIVVRLGRAHSMPSAHRRSVSRPKLRSTRSSAPISRTNWAARSRRRLSALTHARLHQAAANLTLSP